MKTLKSPSVERRTQARVGIGNKDDKQHEGGARNLGCKFRPEGRSGSQKESVGPLGGRLTVVTEPPGNVATESKLIQGQKKKKKLGAQKKRKGWGCGA